MTKNWQFGLIGYPLEHSRSPLLHRAALDHAGLVGDYHLLPVPPLPEGAQVMEKITHNLRSRELDGVNVTIPHKQSVFPYLDQVSKTAEAVGAVNTISSKGNQLLGDNTDADGFMADATRLNLPETGKAVILGAGGGARAAAFALLERNWQVLIVARRRAQAEAVAAELGRMTAGRSISAVSSNLLVEALPGTDLLVNATPAGMFPEIDQSPWPDGVTWPDGARVYDMVYNPLETKFLRDAQAAGLTVRSGIGMLVEQAALAFEIWTGIDPSRREMTAALEN